MATVNDELKPRLLGAVWVYLLVAMLLMMLGCLLYGLWGDYFGWPRLSVKQLILWGVGLWLALCWLCPLILLGWDVLAVRRVQRVIEAFTPVKTSLPSLGTPSADQQWSRKLHRHLRKHYGFLWYRKVRLFLIVGDPAQIAAVAPGLSLEDWLEGDNTVLLWAGSPESPWGESLVAEWRWLFRRCALEGVVWVVSKEQCTDAAVMGTGSRHLQTLANALRWHLPLHLWQITTPPFPQPTRNRQPIGCLLPPRLTPEVLASSLENLLDPLRSAGLAQMQEASHHDFLLRLSRDLQAEGIARWRQALTPLLGVFSRGVPLRGLWFSPPLPPTGSSFEMDKAWQGVFSDKPVKRRLGWGTYRIAYTLTLSLTLLWTAGLLLSFTHNRTQITRVQTVLHTLQSTPQGDAQLPALNDLAHELARLDYRAAHGTPWYQRFGLNQNQLLLETLWPHYVEANNRLIRDPLAAILHQQLTALLKLAPDNPGRTKDAYAQLKAYLMMARPEKTDATFLLKTLNALDPARPGMPPGLRQFYAEHLPANPSWRIPLDPRLVAQVRQLLLRQLGQRNAEASLYQQVLDDTAHHYPALGLHQLVGDTDAFALFATDASVPGVFTRQAWEGQVRNAIDRVAEARREEIDWVLSDHAADLDARLNPAQLRERLTERYFQDYASAWLDMLNSLRWQAAGSLDEVIDQLTLMSDVRQSPLIALMNTLAYQGQAGARTQALADALVKSAQKLIGQDKAPRIDPLADVPGSPLDATFGPLLALLDKRNDDGLSLQTFLTRVTRVRLKLQQVSTAPDPLEMTQTLAQSVFQGRSIDLTDTQSYGSLLAASLGAQWGGVAQTMFVQPLEQAWQRVLQPSAAGLNSQWQRSIVNHWDSAFASRYPFAATASDASLPMLGQMIRTDSGRIEQFLQQQLSGVLRKEGNRWLADPRHSQGLRFNPQFLSAINQLSELADVLYTDGGMGLRFELQGKPVRDVVQTRFILNGETHDYFNQKESWQRFNWPGRGDYPGASLSWTSVHTGERLFGDYPGTWGLLRLLEKAQVTPLDDADSRYRVVLKAPDGLNLVWHLRTELQAGPFALLKLRGFKLPRQIFLREQGMDTPYAQNGSVP